MSRPEKPFEQKYLPEPNTGCWLWTAGWDRYGYGMLAGNVKAHRRSYELHVGEIPAGLCVCHKCDTPACVNPDHLFLGSNRDNVADMRAKGRAIQGEAVHKAKLTEANVREILASLLPCHELASLYGVSDTAISYIKLGKTWRSVPRPSNYMYSPKRPVRDGKTGTFVRENP